MMGVTEHDTGHPFQDDSTIDTLGETEGKTFFFPAFLDVKNVPNPAHP